MKPIVIYLDKHDDEIKMSRKEFEEYINKAYDQGYASGYAEGKKYNYYPWWSGNSITYTNSNTPATLTSKEYNPNDHTIVCGNVQNPSSITTSTTYLYDNSESCFTCEAHNDIGDKR